MFMEIESSLSREMKQMEENIINCTLKKKNKI